MKKLDLIQAGGNYIHLKRNLQRLDVDCSHWTGQGWNKNEQLKDWQDYTRNSCIKKHLIKERGHKCEKCGSINWLGVEIPLELHHEDGNRTNMNKDNLKLYCPNCHSLTPNFRKRK